MSQDLIQQALIMVAEQRSQCEKLIGLVEQRDSYLEKAVRLIEAKDDEIAAVLSGYNQVIGFLKACVENPEILNRQEVLKLIADLPSTH